MGSQEDRGFVLFPHILKELCGVDVAGCAVVWPQGRTRGAVAGDFTTVVSVCLTFQPRVI